MANSFVLICPPFTSFLSPLPFHLSSFPSFLFIRYVRLTPDAAMTMVRSRGFTWLPDDDDDKEDEDKKKDKGKEGEGMKGEEKKGDKTDTTNTINPLTNTITDTETLNNKNQNKEQASYSYHSNTPLLFNKGETTPVGQGPNRREPWYGVYYHLETNPVDVHSRWTSARLQGNNQGEDKDLLPLLSLPPPNPFISYELATSPLIADSSTYSDSNHNNDLSSSNNNNNNHHESTSTLSTSTSTTCPHRPLRSTPPVPITLTLSPSPAQEHGLANGLPQGLPKGLLQQSEGQSQDLKVWLSNDEVFNQPKTVFQLLLHTDKDNEIADGHPANSLITSVHAQLVSTKYYPATLAGLGYSLTVSARGLGLSFVGYSNKLPVLVKQVGYLA